MASAVVPRNGNTGILCCRRGLSRLTHRGLAPQTQALKPETFATQVQMARDIYPHDKVGDEYYVVEVKGHDTTEGIETGIAALNAAT